MKRLAILAVLLPLISACGAPVAFFAVGGRVRLTGFAPTTTSRLPASRTTCRC